MTKFQTDLLAAAKKAVGEGKVLTWGETTLVCISPSTFNLLATMAKDPIKPPKCVGPKPKGIKLEVLDDGPAEHFCLYFDRPGRAEISLINSDAGESIVCHVYDGVDVKTDQIPLGAYDGTGENETWET